MAMATSTAPTMAARGAWHTAKRARPARRLRVWTLSWPLASQSGSRRLWRRSEHRKPNHSLNLVRAVDRGIEPDEQSDQDGHRQQPGEKTRCDRNDLLLAQSHRGRELGRVDDPERRQLRLLCDRDVRLDLVDRGQQVLVGRLRLGGSALEDGQTGITCRSVWVLGEVDVVVGNVFLNGGNGLLEHRRLVLQLRLEEREVGLHWGDLGRHLRG